MSIMSISIRGVEAKLPPGFRFHPRDDELVCDYLMRKLIHAPSNSHCPLMSEVDLNKCEPWDIPEATCVGGKEWYFYSHLDRKYATGLRTNRATASGYWKATGKDRPITRKGALVGMRKTLVFYRGRAPKGRKTNWVMHEFRVEGSLNHLKNLHLHKDEWVLCRMFHKSRDEVAKPGIEVNSGRWSPPPLMDPNLTFVQTRTSHYEQVPCFSNFTVNQGDPLFMADSGLFQPRTQPSYTNIYSGIKDSGSSLDPCDERVLSSVPSHLTRMERNPGLEEPVNLGQGSFSPEGFEVEMGRRL